MRPALLAAAIAEDRAAGWLPLAVVATVGTTSSTSVDPLPEIAELCRRESIWLHVDAAYAGVAAMVPGYEWILRGAEHADSLVVNPHKWLFTPFDLSALYCRHMDLRARRVRADARVPEDRGGRAGAQPDGHRRSARAPIPRAEAVDGAAPLRRGRPARAARRAHAARAALRRSGSTPTPRFERLAPVPFSVVCFRALPAGTGGSGHRRVQRAAARAVNSTGEIFISHTRLDGRYALRLAIGNLHTTESHVARAWALLQAARRRACA